MLPGPCSGGFGSYYAAWSEIINTAVDSLYFLDQVVLFTITLLQYIRSTLVTIVAGPFLSFF